ncbi:major facilitator superfamily domain-containing protein [Dactylonectria estremocensis]|uniref:Major facilitator superfamily domain-containing protein n=1 Tax=Dactylonectria estremocensis TaxID=1079267 RepID=A0A9P9E030_9HYPO|nr:major facilitator superfamily domain-containing protein [Dactylonectria estremocensis]
MEHDWYSGFPHVPNVRPLASSMMAPGGPEIVAEFNSTDDMAATFMVSVFVFGFAFGPLLMAPMSELYGRLPAYHVSNSFFIVFSVGCALSQNIAMLMAFRFLSGLVGVAVVTCGSAAMSVWSIGPLLGPVIGPVCAGFLVESRDWRWVFWVTTIVAGAAVMASYLILRETYAPIILERKAAKLRIFRLGTPKEVFLIAIACPARMFIFSPIVTVVCIYITTLYGLLFLLFTTFTFVYSDYYGFSTIGAGLSFISGSLNNLLGFLFVGYLSDKILKETKAQGKPVEPEQRLDLNLTIPTALCLPLGLIMYGWTTKKHLHWIVIMIGTAVIGFGMIGIFMISQTYLVDSFTIYAASVTAANAVLRSLLGALLPLCGLRLYESIGLDWGNTLLGLIALMLTPVPWLLHLISGRIRNNPKIPVKHYNTIGP